MTSAKASCLSILCLAVAAGALPVAAQTNPVGWNAKANLSAVATSGNTSTATFGAKLRLERNWLRTGFFAEGGSVYQNASEGTRFAVGTTGAFSVVDETERVKKAENYFTDLGFERRVTETLFWRVTTGWKRDVFSGIDRQLAGRAGLGLMRVRPESELKVGAEATYTDEQNAVEDPARENPFFGGRLFGEWQRKFGEGQRSQFQTRFALDQNFQTSDDTRVHWDNALTVSMNQRLALQLGYVLDWRNLPALEELPLYKTQALARAGGSAAGQVTHPLEKLDHVLQVSVVINWSPRPPSVAKPTP